MEDYLHTIYLKSAEQLGSDLLSSFSALLEKDKGIENFRISSDGVYIEYNAYLSTQFQIEETLLNSGFRKKKEGRIGFVRRQISNLAESNKKTYGSQKLDCCQ